MVDREAPALYFETTSIIREKLAEAGIAKSDQEAKPPNVAMLFVGLCARQNVTPVHTQPDYDSHRRPSTHSPPGDGGEQEGDRRLSPRLDRRWRIQDFPRLITTRAIRMAQGRTELVSNSSKIRVTKEEITKERRARQQRRWRRQE